MSGMAACPVAVQRGTLKRLDEAFSGFFRRVKAGGAPGFPKFRGRRSFDSFSAVSGVRVRGGRIHIPGLGGMAVRRKGGNPYPDGKPLSAVLKRRNDGKRFVTVCYAVQAMHADEPADNGHAVGVDRNAGQVADKEGLPPQEGQQAEGAGEAPACEGAAESREPPPQLASPGEPQYRGEGRNGRSGEAGRQGHDPFGEGNG